MSANELPIGIYDIPKDCRAIVQGGNVIVREKRKTFSRAGGVRCKDCKYYQEGQATFSISLWKTTVCKMKPKKVGYDIERAMKKYNLKYQLYYAASPYGKPCEMFELKEKEE